jgi:hypothetical protein
MSVANDPLEDGLDILRAATGFSTFVLSPRLGFGARRFWEVRL